MKAAMAGLACVCWSNGLLAAAPRVSLEASGVSDCMSDEELARRVEQGLEGRSADADEALRVIIEAKRSGALTARVGWFRGESALGERSIESARSDCRELDAALVLVATTLFEEARDAERRAPEERRPTEKTPGSDGTTPTPPPRWVQQPPRDDDTPSVTPAPSRHAKVGSALLVGGSVAVGVLSETSLALRLDSRFELGNQLTLWLGAQGVPWSSARRVEEAQVDFAVVTATAAACWSPAVSARWVIDACGGVNGGVIASRGTAIRGEPDTVAPLLWPIAALAVNAPVWSTFVARAHVAGGPALFQRDYFVTDSVGAPHAVRQAGPALWEGALALGFLLP